MDTLCKGNVPTSMSLGSDTLCIRAINDGFVDMHLKSVGKLLDCSVACFLDNLTLRPLASITGADLSAY